RRSLGVPILLHSGLLSHIILLANSAPRAAAGAGGRAGRALWEPQPPLSYGAILDHVLLGTPREREEQSTRSDQSDRRRQVVVPDSRERELLGARRRSRRCSRRSGRLSHARRSRLLDR